MTVQIECENESTGDDLIACAYMYIM